MTDEDSASAGEDLTAGAMLRGLPDDALPDYLWIQAEREFELAPDDLGARNNLAAVLYMTGQYNAAVEVARFLRAGLGATRRAMTSPAVTTPAAPRARLRGRTLLLVIVGVVVGISLMGIHRLLGPVAGAGISRLQATPQPGHSLLG
mgnify:CR=1 FL=1